MTFLVPAQTCLASHKNDILSNASCAAPAAKRVVGCAGMGTWIGRVQFTDLGLVGTPVIAKLNWGRRGGRGESGLG